MTNENPFLLPVAALGNSIDRDKLAGMVVPYTGPRAVEFYRYSITLIFYHIVSTDCDIPFELEIFVPVHIQLTTSEVFRLDVPIR